MAPISSVRVATCVVAAALVGAAAATLPQEARAEDGAAAVSPETVTTMPAIDAAALAGEASAAVESAVTDAVSEATGAAPAAEPAESQGPASAAPATDTASQSEAGTGTPAAPAAAPEASGTSASTQDTTAGSADTTPDIASSAPVAPAPAPQTTSGATQTAPSNVNVTVRIGSAGDNGPVTQVNVAAAASVAATTSTSSSSLATPTSSSASASQTTAPAVSPAATSSSSAPQDDPWTWTWQWNCLSMPDLTAISPNGSTNGSAPKNWTWIWNCGSNTTQYQDATSQQYQPSNVNVSIRISSPGNDGPVTQANIAAALGVATGASAVAAAVHASIAPEAVQAAAEAPPPALPWIPVVPALPSLPELVLPSDVPATIGDLTGVTSDASQSSIFDLGELPLAVLPPFPGTAPSGQGGRGWNAPLLFGSGSAPWFAPATLRNGGTGGRSGVLAETGTSRGGPVAGDAATPGREKPRPAPRWKAPAAPQPLPASVSSGTSVAPPSGGGSSGGGIPIFLALPFLAAMLDLARRVTLDRVALPSGHRSRMPENPG